MADADRQNGNGSSIGHREAPGEAGHARTNGAVAEVPLEDLKRGFTARFGPEDVKHAKALVETFEKLPAILVHRASMKVIDGNHRVLAARMLNRRTIPAVFFDGDAAEAYVEAVSYNIAHGRPLSIQERERAACRLLAMHPDWSDRRISEVCGLSPKTVARRRPPATAPDPQLSRLGRDGRKRPADPAAARLHIAELVAARPDASLRDIAEWAGSSEATVRDVRERLREGKSPLRKVESERRGCSTPADPGVVPPLPARWSEDTALRSTPPGKDFAAWLDSGAIEDSQWQQHIDELPLSRLPLIASEARRRSECWARLSDALNTRIRSSSRR